LVADLFAEKVFGLASCASVFSEAICLDPEKRKLSLLQQTCSLFNLYKYYM